MTHRTTLAAVLGCAVLCGLPDSGVAPRATGEQPTMRDAEAERRKSPFETVETEDLHNAHRVTDKLISGAAPETEQAFKDLQALGVTTIVSVDGATPDAEAARRHGMRYVHLPIGYDGVKQAQGRDIAKALSELPGPIYLHCHHGKHRSAAAAAVGCVINGTLEPDDAELVLKTFGTGANYVGLWEAARKARPLDAEALRAIEVDYVEQATIPELAERMVAMDETWERLKAVRRHEWNRPGDHPDIDPAHEAVQLEEHFRETGRSQEAATRPAEYRKLLARAEAAAVTLRKTLETHPVDGPAAETAFGVVAGSCVSCHKAYRD